MIENGTEQHRRCPRFAAATMSRLRGRPEMLDHILASPSLASRVRGVEAHNEGLGDEALGVAAIAGSSHAPLVAEFALDRTD
jgi:exonuclease III